MEKNSRTEYSLRNSAVGMLAKILAILAGYVTRMVLVRVLSSDYVGVNGLLTNIMGAFALSALGVDTALVYAMYAPAAEGDLRRQRALMQLYSRIYRIFALVVLGFGLLIYPLLPLLVRERAQIASLELICALYILNTVLSYLWAYKRMMFLVHQRNYINELFDAGFLILQNVLQCLLLLRTGSYLLFLLTGIACTLVRNLLLTSYADRVYPFLREGEAAPVEEGERRSILRNIRAMLIHKTGMVVINNTDNLLLTAMFGLLAVGSYSNYYLIIGSVAQVLDRIIYGITASVGNLGATEDRSRVGRIFRVSFFATAWIYGFAAISLFVLLNPFVELSFGSRYLLPQVLTAVLSINLYLNGVRRATLVFRDSLGLFWYDRYKTPVEALVNLTASIVLARRMGMTGVFVGTTVSILLISFWVEPFVLYREYLKEPLAPYFGRFFLYLAAVALGCGATWWLCALVGGSLLRRFVLRLLLCLTVPNLLFYTLSRHFWEMGVLKDRFVPAVRRRLRRLRGRG